MYLLRRFADFDELLSPRLRANRVEAERELLVFLGPEDPLGAVCVLLSRTQQSALLQQRAGVAIHVCIQTLRNVGKLPAVIRQSSPAKSSFDLGSAALKKSG